MQNETAQVLDLTPSKPTYDQLVERLNLLCNFVQNVGTDMGNDKSYGKQANRGQLARTMRLEAADARLLVTLAKCGK